MGRLEHTLLDKFVNGAFAGKRVIGSPLKYNLKQQERGVGWLELMFNPKNRFEEVCGEALRFINPYLSFVTYRFHVEKARDAGMRVEDLYTMKFHKEPYILMHIYAQYFHPSTLQERVRNVRFHRSPRTIYKGFTVPEWATAKARGEADYDAYSRQAWESAMEDFRSEWTPTQFRGHRQQPNPLQWFRFEQVLNGNGNRLFYNEVPQPTWWRENGHILENNEDEKERFQRLHSFTHADQSRNIIFGIDTTTEEGRKKWTEEYNALAELAPEMLKKDEIFFPHEIPAQVPKEPHFRRVWQHYRIYKFKNAMHSAVEAGKLSEDDVRGLSSICDLNGVSSFQLVMMAKSGQLEGAMQPDDLALCNRVFNAIGLGQIEFDTVTAEPVEEQFWRSFDFIYDLSEKEMKKELPNYVPLESNQAKVEALRSNAALN